MILIYLNLNIITIIYIIKYNKIYYDIIKNSTTSDYYIVLDKDKNVEYVSRIGDLDIDNITLTMQS